MATYTLKKAFVKEGDAVNVPQGANFLIVAVFKAEYLVDGKPEVGLEIWYFLIT